MFLYTIIGKPKGLKLDKKVIDTIISEINSTVDKSQNGTVNIIFESDETIKELNKTYRTIDKTTDVLSFHYFDDYGNIESKTIAGEIILSKNKIESQAVEYGIKEEEELYKLLIHSILHLIGFDHEDEDDYKDMLKFEQLIEKTINEKFLLNIK